MLRYFFIALLSILGGRQTAFEHVVSDYFLSFFNSVSLTFLLHPSAFVYIVVTQILFLIYSLFKECTTLNAEYSNL